MKVMYTQIVIAACLSLLFLPRTFAEVLTVSPLFGVDGRGSGVFDPTSTDSPTAGGPTLPSSPASAFRTLAAALVSAKDGDDLLLRDGRGLTLTSSIVEGKSLNIEGEHELVEIECKGIGPHLYFGRSAEELLAEGKTGVFNSTSSHLTLSVLTLRGCAVEVKDTFITITQVRFLPRILSSGREVIGPGPALLVTAVREKLTTAVVVTDSVFDYYRVQRRGLAGVEAGAIAVEGFVNVSLSSTSFLRNGGGGLKVRGSRDVQIRDCLFQNNSNNEAGGGASITGTATATVLNSRFFSNSGSSGGALSLTSTSLYPTTVSNCTFSLNRASVEGGAVQTGVRQSVNITSSRFVFNSAVEEGGAISGRKSGAEDGRYVYRPGPLSAQGDLSISSSPFEGVLFASHLTFVGNTAKKRGVVSSLRWLAAVLNGNATQRDGRLAGWTIPPSPLKPSLSTGSEWCGGRGGLASEEEDGKMQCVCDTPFRMSSRTKLGEVSRLRAQAGTVEDGELIPVAIPDECSIRCPTTPDGKVCGGHGVCKQWGVTEATCECVPPYLTKYCNETCPLGVAVDGTSAKPVECGGVGTCTKKGGRVGCVCPVGYAGDACDRKWLFVRGTARNETAPVYVRLGTKVVYESAGRGLHVVVFNSTTFHIIRSGVFDTFARPSDEDTGWLFSYHEARQLAAMLRQLHLLNATYEKRAYSASNCTPSCFDQSFVEERPDAIVVVASYGGWAAEMTADAIAELDRIGGVNMTNVTAGDYVESSAKQLYNSTGPPFALLSAIGIPAGGGLQVAQANPLTGNPHAEVYVQLQRDTTTRNLYPVSGTEVESTKASHLPISGCQWYGWDDCNQQSFFFPRPPP